MNSNIEIRKTLPLAVRGGFALALTLFSAAAFAQSSITLISVPGAASLTVSGMNTNGHVAGYYLTADSMQRAFFWADGLGSDLGTLGGSLAVANGLNNLDQVVGYSTTADDAQYHAFIFSSGSLLDLGTLGGTVASTVAINDAGQATGYSDISPISLSYRAILATAGGMVSLGTLGGSFSSGNAINSAGQVVGEASLSGNFQSHAFLYSGGVMRDLGTFGGSASSAFAVNGAGHVTGQADTTSDVQTHAFLYDGTALRDLGTLGGTYSAGYAINNAGQVAGDSFLAGDVGYHAFLSGNGTRQDLGTLGGANSSTWGLNNLGQVVGVASDASGEDRAFLWKDDAMTDLNALLPANSGWQLTGAFFIDDHGHIAGTGLFQGQASWFLMTLSTAQNHPPVADAGPDQALECNAGFALVAFNGSASSDPDGDALTFEWLEGSLTLGTGATASASLPNGSHTITLRVTDPQGLSAEDTLVVVIGDTTPPVIVCPAPVSVPVNDQCGAVVPDFLATLVASDNCTADLALVKTQSPAAGSAVGSGVHLVVLTVVDAAGLSTTCTVTFTVADSTSPVVQAPAELTRSVTADCQAAVPDLSLEIVAADNCTPVADLAVTQTPAAGTLVGLGTQEVRVTVTDAAGNATTRVVLLHVVDDTQPVIQSLTATPNILSPANKKMVPVTLSVVASDNCDANPISRIVSVTSSEADNPDSTSSDWIITGDLTLELRAEVLSKTVARVYTVTVSCTDASGNTSYSDVVVTVPSKKNPTDVILTQTVSKVNSGKKK